MLHNIVITTGALAVNTVECSCGYRKESTNGIETERLACIHARENHPASIFEVNPGNPSRRHHNVERGRI